MRQAEKLLKDLRARRQEELLSGRLELSGGGGTPGPTGPQGPTGPAGPAGPAGGVASGSFDMDDGNAAASGGFDMDEGGA